MRFKLAVSTVALLCTLTAKADQLYDYHLHFTNGDGTYQIYGGTIDFVGTLALGYNNLSYVSGDVGGYSPVTATTQYLGNELEFQTPDAFPGDYDGAVVYLEALFQQTATGFADTDDAALVFFTEDPYGQAGEPTTVSLTVTPVAATTPEPSSFVLLGTGLLGVAGVLRKRVV